MSSEPKISTEHIRSFQTIVWEYYAQNGRHDLPWRLPRSDGSFDPYAILVSELMLQQTQVSRVIPKYQAWMAQFPTFTSVAEAELGDILRAWQGLGYNRRAKYLWNATRMIESTYQGVFPKTLSEITALPGVGVNTAGAIIAYAYDEPSVFVETNIRTVYIYHFLDDKDQATDTDIVGLVRQTLPADESIREWYWALMDYGTHLKQSVGNLNKLSKAYTKQSPFHGSKRQIRGMILRMLSNDKKTIITILSEIPDERTTVALAELEAEGLIQKRGDTYSL